MHSNKDDDDALVLSVQACFSALLTWTFIAHLHKHVFEHSVYTGVGIGLAGITGLVCFVALFTVLLNSAETPELEINNYFIKYSRQVNFLSYLMLMFGSIFLLIELAYHLKFIFYPKLIHDSMRFHNFNLFIRGNSLFFFMMLFLLVIGHGFKALAPLGSSPNTGTQGNRYRDWKRDLIAFSLLVQTIGFFAMFNNAAILTTTPALGFHLSSTATKSMFILGILAPLLNIIPKCVSHTKSQGNVLNTPLAQSPKTNDYAFSAKVT